MVNETNRVIRCCHRSRWEKIAMIMMWSFVLLGLCSAVSAEPLVFKDSIKEPMLEHLEFLGYECDFVEAGIRAQHLSKIHLYITFAFGGIRFQTGFPGLAPHSDVSSRYKVTNALMQKLSVMQLFWSDEGSLFAMAWMPGRYDKARFALFMEAWDHDAALLQQTYDQLKPFLKTK